MAGVQSVAEKVGKGEKVEKAVEAQSSAETVEYEWGRELQSTKWVEAGWGAELWVPKYAPSRSTCGACYIPVRWWVVWLPDCKVDAPGGPQHSSMLSASGTVVPEGSALPWME